MFVMRSIKKNVFLTNCPQTYEHWTESHRCLGNEFLVSGPATEKTDVHIKLVSKIAIDISDSVERCQGSLKYYRQAKMSAQCRHNMQLSAYLCSELCNYHYRHTNNFALENEHADLVFFYFFVFDRQRNKQTDRQTEVEKMQ